MKYETTHNLTLPKIGFGTWNIGGDTRPDREFDDASLTALRSALQVGYTHFDTAEFYAAGHCEELLGRAIRKTKTPREDVFITSKVSPEHLSYDKVLKSCENSLRHLKLDYIDLYLIHWPPQSISKLDECFPALDQLVRDGKVRHLGVSNFNLKWLTRARELSETPIVANQVPFSISDRSYIKNGVFEYCRQNDILITAYSPLDEGKLRSKANLEMISRSHNATIFQIALAWIISHPGVITIPMSFNPLHIKENFAAADIELNDTEIGQLSDEW